MGTLSKLRRLVLRENVSVREAARRLRISRNTAKRWLAQPDMVAPTYPKRASAAGLLDPYKEHLALWLKADSQRGKRERRTVGAYFESIRAMGFSGSKNLVYAYCRDWKQEQDNAPRHAGFVPLSFELGEAFQFDWSCEYVVIGVCAGAWKWPTRSSLPVGPMWWWPTSPSRTKCCLTPTPEPLRF